MKHAGPHMEKLGCIAGTITMALLVGGGGSTTARQLNSAPQNVAVYVRDFELAVPTIHNISATKPTSGGGNTRSNLTPKQQVDALQTQAKSVTDFVANTLVETLRKNGYTSARNQGRPANGILLEGVFGEPDGKNRIRRALLGGGARGTKFILYVGTFDQRSMNQPLYKEAPAQAQEPDEHYGPVITLNAYIPLAKYEINKDASEDDLRKICEQITSNLTALLGRNPSSVVQSQ